MQVLPEGLSWCEFCGKVRGTTPDGSVSLCLCDGIVCRYCGAGRIYKPISDQYVPDRDGPGGRWMHMAYFGYLGPCEACERLAYPQPPADGIYAFPGPLSDDPGISTLLEIHREAAAALAPTREERPPDYDRQLREHGLFDPPAWITVRQAVALRDVRPDDASRGVYALHAAPEIWNHLGLDHPPDGRPLALDTLPLTGLLDARRGAPVRDDLTALLGAGDSDGEQDGLTGWMRDELEVTTWVPRGEPDVGRIAAMLFERWRPPLPSRADRTPWSDAIEAARREAW